MENNLIRCDIYYWSAVRDDDEQKFELGVCADTVYIKKAALEALQRDKPPYFLPVRHADDENASITLIQTENVNEINQINKVNIQKERLILAKEQ